MRYGRLLLAKLPEDTMQFLVDICAGPAPEDISSPTSATATNGISHPRVSSSGMPYLSYLSLNRSNGTEGVAPRQSAPPRQISHSRSTTLDQPDVRGVASEIPLHSTLAQASGSNTLIQRPSPSPSQFFAHFVHHPDYFIRFLEAVAFRKWGQRVDLEEHSAIPHGGAVNLDEDRNSQAAVWNTLLELYLTSASEAGTPLDDESRTLLRKKAMKVLENDDRLPYDPTHALIVCSTHSFTEGLVLLWEKMGMYEDVLRFWMDRTDSQSELAFDDATSMSASSRVVQYLTLYGPEHPHLYSLVLRFLTSSPTLLSRHSADVKNILDHIEQEKIMPPIAVIQILSRNDVASVGLVKQWLMTRIAESREEIEAVSSFFNTDVAPADGFCELLGPPAHRVIPWRDEDEASRNRRAF